MLAAEASNSAGMRGASMTSASSMTSLFLGSPWETPPAGGVSQN